MEDVNTWSRSEFLKAGFGAAAATGASARPAASHVFSEAEARPHLIFVRAGTLDDPKHDQASSNDLDGEGASLTLSSTLSLPAFEGQPPPVA